jgi:hypothetical protein
VKPLAGFGADQSGRAGDDSYAHKVVLASSVRIPVVLLLQGT